MNGNVFIWNTRSPLDSITLENAFREGKIGISNFLQNKQSFTIFSLKKIERKKNCMNPLWNQSLKNPFLNSGSLHRWKLGPFQHFISYFILKNQFSTTGLMIMIDWLMIDWSLQDRTSWWDDDHRDHHRALASAFAAESGWSSYPHSSAHTSQKHIYHCHAEHINNKPLLWTSVSVILLQLQQNKEQD